MKRWMLNYDVAIEVYAADEDDAKEQAARIIEETLGTDELLYSIAATAIIFGPVEVEDKE